MSVAVPMNIHVTETLATPDSTFSEVIAYNEDTGNIYFALPQSDEVLGYRDIPPAVWADLKTSAATASPGVFFHNNIRGKYTYFKITSPVIFVEPETDSDEDSVEDSNRNGGSINFDGWEISVSDDSEHLIFTKNTHRERREGTLVKYTVKAEFDGSEFTKFMLGE